MLGVAVIGLLIVWFLVSFVTKSQRHRLTGPLAKSHRPNNSMGFDGCIAPDISGQVHRGFTVPVKNLGSLVMRSALSYSREIGCSNYATRTMMVWKPSAPSGAGATGIGDWVKPLLSVARTRMSQSPGVASHS